MSSDDWSLWFTVLEAAGLSSVVFVVQVARCESSAAAARQVLRAARDELGLAAAKAFARIDQDGSGTLDKGELKELCRELGIGEAQTA